MRLTRVARSSIRLGKAHAPRKKTRGIVIPADRNILKQVTITNKAVCMSPGGGDITRLRHEWRARSRKAENEQRDSCNSWRWLFERLDSDNVLRLAE